MKSIKSKTMIVLGDQDTSIPIECALNAKKNIPNFYLWILPNTGHVAHEGPNKNLFIEFSKKFITEDWNKSN